MIWDRIDYIKEAEKQLSDKGTYKKVAFKEKLLIELVEKSNCFFKNLKVNGHITEKNLKYFTFKNKKSY